MGVPIVPLLKKENIDLWKRFLKKCSKNNVVCKNPGHSGHIENERCDTLAVESLIHDFEVDEYFENSQKEPPILFR